MSYRKNQLELPNSLKLHKTLLLTDLGIQVLVQQTQFLEIHIHSGVSSFTPLNTLALKTGMERTTNKPPEEF